MSIARVKDQFRACGSTNSATELTCAELALDSGSKERVDFFEKWSETSPGSRDGRAS
ncbi:hypothetical protein NST84_18875 [Paenibacillus sp. FSL R7-0345]|uniref:hypothetical protein n=1 Tax=Paenibacillus sp. FSL R7-0345 TaxID=2954535 RepID=UPI00315A54FD